MGLVAWSVGLGRAAFARGLAAVGALGLLGLDLLRVLNSGEAAPPPAAPNPLSSNRRLVEFITLESMFGG